MLARPDRQKGWGQGEAGMEAEESSLQRKTPLVVEVFSCYQFRLSDRVVVRREPSRPPQHSGFASVL